MNVWTICAGEPLPTDENQPRPMRMSMLTRNLRKRGHGVLWWTSSFNHSAKRQRTPGSAKLTSADGTALRLLHGTAYSQNVGIARLVNHFELAHQFKRLSSLEVPPSLIYCCWPTIELGYTAVRYGRRHSIPVILDVRDLWPDLYLDAAPKWLRAPSHLLLKPYFGMTKFAFSNASAIVGISERYLEWGLSYAGRAREPQDGVFPLGYSAPDLTKTSTTDVERLRALGVNDSRVICWFLGSFGDTYDLELIIGAARQLQAQGINDCQFVLSGDGERGAHLKKLAEGLNNVVFTGWLNESQIACMMKMAHIGLAAYRQGAPQGLPNKVFEYMAAGLPILSSLTGECKQFLKVNQCGVSYSAGSFDSFIAALSALTASTGLRKELGKNGLRTFRGSYSSSIVYPRLVAHIEELPFYAETTSK